MTHADSILLPAEIAIAAKLREILDRDCCKPERCAELMDLERAIVLTGGPKVGVGDTARKVRRFRPTSERCNYIEESIYGDEVPLADWYLCEKCGDLADSLGELGFCPSLGGESLQQQIAEYRREEESDRRRMAEMRTTPNA